MGRLGKLQGYSAQYFIIDEVESYTEEFDQLDEIVEAKRGMRERLALETKESDDYST